MDSLLSIEEEEKSSTIGAVENILSYSFKDKALVEEALTHPAYYHNKNKSNGESFRSYQRLEFVGDVVLGLAVSKHLYLEYPSIDPGQLTDLRSANVSNDRLARVAVAHDLHRYIRHNNNLDVSLLDEIQKFADEVSEEDNIDLYGSIIKGPKILADIVESLAAAIYFDLNFDLQESWRIFRKILEPITPEVLEKHTVDTLDKQCQKQGRKLYIKDSNIGAKNMATVYVDETFIASSSSDQIHIARCKAAKLALLELSKSKPTKFERSDFSFGPIEPLIEIEGAKQKLNNVCQKKRCQTPIYSIVKEEGPPHDKKYVCAAQIETVRGVFSMEGEEKSKVKEAENSAASYLIRALLESNTT